MRLEVDEHRCVGAGQCAWIAPGLFTQRPGDGVVVLLRPRPSDDEGPLAREAVEVCPARAIRLTDTPAPPSAASTEETPR
jgi:ferredoxin